MLSELKLSQAWQKLVKAAQMVVSDDMELEADLFIKGSNGREYISTVGEFEAVVQRVHEHTKRIEELEKALEPFAEVGGELDGMMGYDNIYAIASVRGKVSVSVADFRRARRALREHTTRG